MLILTCPYCGVTAEETEFHGGGEAHLKREGPGSDDAAVSPGAGSPDSVLTRFRTRPAARTRPAQDPDPGRGRRSGPTTQTRPKPGRHAPDATRYDPRHLT